MIYKRTCGELKNDRGFTIIEIMVAILLLSVSLVAIFGAQFSAVASTNFARNITMATQLAKCKMSELELEFQKDGFQEGDQQESGDCCEFMEGEGNADNFTCQWEIKTIVLPDITQMMNSAGADGGVDDDMGGGGMMGGMMGSETGEDMADMGMGMMGAVLPMITGLLEQAIRRVTVKVEWKQGTRTKNFEIIQYVVHPTQGPLQLLQQGNAMQQMSDELDIPGVGGRGPSGGLRR